MWNKKCVFVHIRLEINIELYNNFVYIFNEQTFRHKKLLVLYNLLFKGLRNILYYV